MNRHKVQRTVGGERVHKQLFFQSEQEYVDAVGFVGSEECGPVAFLTHLFEPQVFGGFIGLAGVHPFADQRRVGDQIFVRVIRVDGGDDAAGEEQDDREQHRCRGGDAA